eukprot:TRINITY_DN13690_c0_g1_i1.p2 TRINITY_DN13690_c0_g1~~TRINITY_DN13690_c0_g1_i1.p2  ORF type:complete len:105 (-),score=5.57 TRINITY_DN13690_c0_g1_i1:887-1201(-)
MWHSHYMAAELGKEQTFAIAVAYALKGAHATVTCIEQGARHSLRTLAGESRLRVTAAMCRAKQSVCHNRRAPARPSRVRIMAAARPLGEHRRTPQAAAPPANRA